MAVRKIVRDYAGGDMLTSTDMHALMRQRSNDGVYPDRIYAEKNGKVLEFTGVPRYTVTIEYDEPNPEIEDLINQKKRLIKWVASREPYGYSTKYSRIRLEEIDKRLRELQKITSKYSLNELAKELHEVSREKGFYNDHEIHRDFGDKRLSEVVKRATNSEKLLLIISEISEIVEEQRKPNPDKELIAEEYADVLIRLLDSVAANEVDIDKALEKKRKKNKRREYMHGGKRF